MKRSPCLPLLFLACSHASPPERYGFVAVLGNDTVAVERIARSPTRLVTDGVDRWPFVRRRHTEFDLAADGRIRRMVMDVRTPNGPSPRERGRRITADFSSDAVTISVRDSGGVRDTSFATGGAITVPHVSMMYSVIELEIAAALRRALATGLEPGDSVPFRQFYPDRDVGPSFTLHRGFVRPQGSGKVELRHDWLSGAGDVTVDTSGRMLTYSGMRSTYKVAVARTTTLPDIEAIGDRLAAAERRTGPSQLSVRDTARATIGTATPLGGLRSSPGARADAAGRRDRLRPCLAHGGECRNPVHHLGADHARGIVTAGGDVHPVDRTARPWRRPHRQSADRAVGNGLSAGPGSG